MKINKFPPCYYNGKLTAPASKSHLQRALALSLLSEESTILKNITWCEDTLAAAEMIKTLGAEIIAEKGTIKVIPPQVIKKGQMLNARESGLALRMFAGICAAAEIPVEIMTAGTLHQRPIQPLIKNINQLGFSSSKNFPISISSGIERTHLTLDGSFSSQFITGVLMGLPLRKDNSTLNVINLVSLPYIDITIDIMKYFGVSVEHDEYKEFYIKGNSSYNCKEFTIEGDWSGSSNHLVGAALSGNVTIENLNMDSSQADIEILNILNETGAKIEANVNSVSVQKKNLSPFIISAFNCPDLFPPLAILASGCKGESRIQGTQRLRHKESDRLKSILELLKVLGVKVENEKDALVIHGKGSTNGGQIKSYNDHRIAMAAAISSVIANNKVILNGADCINKSYPDFYEDFYKTTISR